jgi:anti-anti-sigma regulatory factor
MAAPVPRTIVCDVSALAIDVQTIDALARFQLVTRRAGLELRLRRVSVELQELLALVGLDAVLRLEPGGQAEEREQPLRVEEEGELDDPSAG